ncbi:PLP-dependent aminotransferase family protein [Rhodoferax sp. GW822-FHT02A01]|uniref:aminotransferase-like domain-containing protein n=1 Tax=Rhodoferax sp. GW822-FHT02A01 TaxID=3141537 RepID=UPI00315C8FE6
MSIENLISKACLQDTGKPRYLALADELAQFIQNGQLPTGERLPPQRRLAQRLGVTAGTVSHAYEILEQRGMATARVGDGTYVRSPEQAGTPQNAANRAPVDLAHNVAIPTDDGRALAATLQRVAADPQVLRQVLSYQPEAGHARHRQSGAEWLRRFGLGGDASRVMVTHGAQHGLSCVLRALAHPGDVVFTETLSYPGLQALARLMRLQLVGVEMDEEGMLPQALEHAARNITGKLVYCSPSLHNPTNSTMSLQRRQAIAKVVQKHNLLLIEDCVHAASQAAPLPAVSTLLPDQSFVLSSFSKVAGPGLRVGYVEAAPQWLSKLAAAMRADCWMTAPLLPEIASQWIDSGVMEQLIVAQRASMTERRDVAMALLQGMDCRADAESPLIWMPLPEPWRVGQFAAALRQAGVLIRTADHFAVGRAVTPHAVRISLNAARSTAEIEAGMRRILSILHSTPTTQMEP